MYHLAKHREWKGLIQESPINVRLKYDNHNRAQKRTEQDTKDLHLNHISASDCMSSVYQSTISRLHDAGSENSRRPH
ncbi:hypothetical protein NQZ68_004428 [Dissostichus eleginoides]|nr:hypothetical protein NQZ68_004428 [Dissostichus eleginoides]